MYLPEARKRGLTAPLRTAALMAPVTDEVYVAVKRKLNVDDLSKLPANVVWRILQREASMQTGVKLATGLVEDGLQTIVRCKAGQKLAEAVSVTARLNGKEIVDRRTGKKRRLVAQIIRGEMSPEEREFHYDRFNAGEVDVLVHVRVLGMGWDSPRAKGYVDIAPSGMISDTTQNYGRITRPYVNKDGKSVACIGISVIDETAPSNFVTFGDVLDERHNDANKVLAGADVDPDTIHATEFSDELKALFAELEGYTHEEIISQAHTNKLLDSMLGKEYVARRSKELMLLTDAHNLLRIGRSDLINAVRERNMRLKRYPGKPNSLYISMGDLRTLSLEGCGQELEQVPERGYYLLEEIARTLEITVPALQKEIRDNKHAITLRFVDEFRFPGYYLSMESYKQLARAHHRNVAELISYNESEVDF